MFALFLVFCKPHTPSSVADMDSFETSMNKLVGLYNGMYYRRLNNHNKEIVTKETISIKGLIVCFSPGSRFISLSG